LDLADDGNGRLTRAITDLALAQGENQAIRFYAMSASILATRPAYYRVLEDSQKAAVNITPWLEWFLQTLLHRHLGDSQASLRKGHSPRIITPTVTNSPIA